MLRRRRADRGENVEHTDDEDDEDTLGDAEDEDASGEDDDGEDDAGDDDNGDDDNGEDDRDGADDKAKRKSRDAKVLHLRFVLCSPLTSSRAKARNQQNAVLSPR